MSAGRFFSYRVLRVLVCTGAFLFASWAEALEFRGQVLRAGDGTPIQGARVTLDATPGGDVDYEQFSSAFGMFAFVDVPAGAFELRVERTGFNPSVSAVTLTAETETTTVALTANGAEGHDVFLSVYGVMTGIVQSGANVVARRFVGAAGGGGTVEANGTTDGEGLVTLRGLPGGFYEFSVTPTSGGWEPFTSPRVELTQSHHAAFGLNPVKHNLEVLVDGFDPTTEADGPLEGVFVEVTGESEEGTVVVPTRTGVTASNGRVFFRGLPSGVAYFVEAKRLGYTPADVDVGPVNGGAAQSESLTLDIEERSLEVELVHPAYEGLEVFEGLEVQLRGLVETNTEGIERSETAGTAANLRLFEDLIPGRYEVRVEGEGDAAGLEVHPFFSFTDYVEIFDAGKTELEAELVVRPVRILGRLWAATEKGAEKGPEGEERLELDVLLDGRPYYEPRADTEVEFLESEDDPLLIEDERSVRVTTDENGYFSVELPPSLWGMRMESLTDFWGSHVVVKEVGAEPEPLPILPPPIFGQSFPAAGQGWPIAPSWPFPGDPPANGTPKPGLPLVLEGGDIELDAFIRKQVVSVSGPVNADGVPTQLRLAGFEELADESLRQIRLTDYEDLNDGLTVTLKEEGGTELESVLYPAFLPRRVDGGFESDGYFFFEAVPPGTWTLSFDHPRYEVRRYSFPPGGFVEPTEVTWEIKSWGAPGVPPPADPSQIGYAEPMTQMPPGGVSFINFDTFVAEYQEGGPITIRRWDWVEPQEPEDPPARYELSHTDVYTAGDSEKFSFIQVGYASGIFVNAGEIPNKPFTFWDGMRGSATGGEQSFDHYVGGPQDNSYEIGDGTGAPAEFDGLPVIPTPVTGGGAGGGAMRYPLRVIAKNGAEPDGDPISGISIRFNGGLTVVSGQTVLLDEEWSAEIRPPIGVNTAPWVGSGGGNTVLELDADGNPILDGGFPRQVPVLAHELKNVDLEEGVDLVPEVTVFIKRGWEVTGTVSAAGEGLSVAGATVLVRDRFGVVLAEAVTDEVGGWTIPVGVPALEEESPPIFVDIRAGGYVPWRMRYTAADLPPGENVPLNIATTLDPLPRPEIQDPDWNREGKFLTGLYISSKPGATTNALVLNWRVPILTVPHTYSLVPFDDKETGQPGEPEEVTINPKPVEVWLMDPRTFPTHPYNSQPGDEAVYKPGTATDPGKLRQWFDGAVSRQVPNVWFSKPEEPEKVGPLANQYEATGEVKIWKLPPGDFRPIIVVKTDDGGLTIRSDFADPTTEVFDTVLEPLMEGMRLPTWMGDAANVMGLSGALTGGGSLTPEARRQAAQAFDGVFPKGKFSALPGFNGTILAVGEGERKVLKYSYDIEMKWLEGMTSPGNRWLRFMTDPAGVELTMTVGMGLDNTLGDTPFFIRGKLTKAPPPDDLVPPDLEGLQTKTPKYNTSTKATLSAEVKVAGSEVTPEGTFELKVDSTVTADLLTELEVSLTPVLNKIPAPTGPILQGLDSSKILQLFMALDGGVGVDVGTRWETKPLDPGSAVPGDHVQLISFPLGTTNRLSLKPPRIGLGFGGGMKAKLFNGRIGVKVTLGTAGPATPFSFPTLNATINPSNGWPLIERIKGSLGMNVKGDVNLWVVKWEKSWSVPFIDIDQPFTTEAVFSWEPIGVTFTSTGPGDAPSPTLNPGDGMVIGDFYAAGALSAAQGGGDELLVYTGINPANGRMTVEVGKRSAGGEFGASTVVGEAGGVIDVASARLANGQWLVVWSEIADGDVGALYPGSVLRYATSSDGAVWSAPATIGAPLADVAERLRLVAQGDLAVLAVTTTGGGPMATTFDLHVAAFEAGAWTETRRQVTRRGIVDYDLALFGAAGAEKVIVATADGVDATDAFVWDTSNGGITNVPTLGGAAASLSLAGGGGGPVALARVMASGGIEVRAFDEGSLDWGVATDTLPLELASNVKLSALGDGAAYPYLLSWVSGGDVSLLNYAYLDAAGNLATAPVVAEGSADGDFRDLVVFTRGGEDVLLGADPVGGGVHQAVASRDADVVRVRIVNPRWSAITGFTADVDGIPGRVYRVLRSADLLNWTEAGEVPSGGSFVDPAATEEEETFYKAE